MKTPLVALITLAAVLGASSAQASLGDRIESVESDRVALSGARHEPRALNGYRVETLSSAGGVIREYVSNDGLIFGVAWSGRIHPDLSVLLGSKFDEYRHAALRAPRALGLRGHRSVAGESVVVETWGHMRALGGHAFLPSQLPEGVSADDIL